MMKLPLQRPDWLPEISKHEREFGSNEEPYENLKLELRRHGVLKLKLLTFIGLPYLVRRGRRSGYSLIMTIERRLLVGIDDIKGICFECLKCHARQTIMPDKIGDVPTACPRCHEPWITFRPGPTQSLMKSPFADFAESIERIRALQNEGATQGVRVLLEFEEPQ